MFRDGSSFFVAGSDYNSGSLKRYARILAVSEGPLSVQDYSYE